jgi:Mg-chelatase subunit ChlD
MASLTVAFLVDTSGSMSQRSEKGFSYLDIARNLISLFQTQAQVKAPQVFISLYNWFLEIVET